ncbi:MAG: hypothetical protein ACO3FX_02985 [Gemmobacter sp.]
MVGDADAVRARHAGGLNRRGARPEVAPRGTRPVWFAGGWAETPVYWRDHLPDAARIEGPAIIEQMDTTILIEPGDVATGDGRGNLIIAVGGH